MANTEAPAPRTCGTCDKWRETKDRCPGMGFCGHPKASTTKVGYDRINLTCRFLPSGQACLIGNP